MATITQTSSITINPSGYDSSNSSYSSISTSYPISNAYTSSDSTTYAQVTLNTGSNAGTYISLTFDLSSIPSNATINSVSCTVKAGTSTTTTTSISSASAQLYNGTTAMGTYVSVLKTTATAIEITSTGTWTRDTLDNLLLRFSAVRGTKNTTTTRYLNIYGADLTISYTWNETTYTITSTITGGTITSTNPDTVSDGDTATVTFTKTTDTDILKSMTVNGTEVTPTYTNSQYEYELSNVSEDKTIEIVFGSNGPTLYIKIDETTWKSVKKIYKKTSTGWETITSDDFNTLATGNKFNKLDTPEQDSIGDVTSSTNAINITSDSVTSGTYTLYYEDSDSNKLSNWGEIGTITVS